MFSPQNLIRRVCHKVLYNRCSEIFIQICIIVNVIALAMRRPDRNTPDEKETYDVVLDWIDFAFVVLFAVEMLMRMVTQGVLFGRFAYFRDPWNRIDFLVVVSGVLYISLSVTSGLRGFRAFRAIRPVLCVPFLDGVRAIFQSLSASLSQLLNVAAIVMFSLIVFGVAGIQLFGGIYRRRCVLEGSGEVSLPDSGVFCVAGETSSGWFGRRCDTGQSCDESYGNPFSGYTSFDDLGHSSLVIFIVSTLQGWSDFLYWTMDSKTRLAWIYFILIIFFMRFVVVNLFVAVINQTFSDVRKKESRVSAFSTV
jgi:hypothetical protein